MHAWSQLKLHTLGETKGLEPIQSLTYSPTYAALLFSNNQGVCGREGCGVLFHKYHPDFPAGSPYVTAVGGTDFSVAGVIGDEKAWIDGGGGFSDTFPIPPYQKAAVASYLSNPDADLPQAK